MMTSYKKRVNLINIGDKPKLNMTKSREIYTYRICTALKFPKLPYTRHIEEKCTIVN